MGFLKRLSLETDALENPPGYSTFAELEDALVKEARNFRQLSDLELIDIGYAKASRRIALIEAMLEKLQYDRALFTGRGIARFANELAAQNIRILNKLDALFQRGDFKRDNQNDILPVDITGGTEANAAFLSLFMYYDGLERELETCGDQMEFARAEQIRRTLNTDLDLLATMSRATNKKSSRDDVQTELRQLAATMKPVMDTHEVTKIHAELRETQRRGAAQVVYQFDKQPPKE